MVTYAIDNALTGSEDEPSLPLETSSLKHQPLLMEGPTNCLLRVCVCVGGGTSASEAGDERTQHGGSLRSF